MKPFFFGGDRELFGCYHPSAGHAARSTGVVMCNPFFGEYVQQHRLFNRLAERLSKSGLATLRFDWYGTGDSADDLLQASLERWREDIAAAVSWLRRQARVSSIVLVGSRLGACLATQVGREDPEVTGFALWEPVLDGADYLAELAYHHEKGLADYLSGVPEPETATELLGFCVPNPLLEQIRAVRISAALPNPEQPLFVVGGEATLAAARQTLAPILAGTRFHQAAFPPGWLQPEDGIYDILVPAAPLRATAEWIEGVAS